MLIGNCRSTTIHPLIHCPIDRRVHTLLYRGMEPSCYKVENKPEPTMRIPTLTHALTVVDHDSPQALTQNSTLTRPSQS